ncbi:MAG: UDP-3-O-acyl-N-acetylglucosamine deacetylase [Ferrovum sp.]|nr:UDP-3-O-acyl-N-acetylglucosamine deacetylase [Ferrovum sp.]
MLLQRTLAQKIQTTGIGLHSGLKVDLVIHPAGGGHGVVFVRTDLPGSPRIPAQATLVTDTKMCTVLEDGGAKVGTVEHLMSALSGLGIDNVLIEVSAPEVPIMDGSSGPFIYLLQSAGIVEQDVPKRYIEILSPIDVVEGEKWARFEPHYGFKITYEGQFKHPVFERMSSAVTMDFATTSYVKEVSRARTFGFTRDVEMLRNQGLALGGSLDNAIVMDDYRVLNLEGLRYPDEFLRHKILDALGDLYLLGHPLIGSFTGHLSGHALNNMAARELLNHPERWRFVSFSESKPVPSCYTEPIENGSRWEPAF